LAGLLVWLLKASHVPAIEEIELISYGVARAVLVGSLVWLGYVALEPLLRRWWPDTLVSWNRLLAGRIRDPRIGRDVLLGLFFGLALVVYEIVLWWGVDRLGIPPRRPDSPTFALLQALRGGRHIAASVLELFVVAVGGTVVFALLLLILRIVFRKPWLAIGILGVISIVPSMLAMEPALMVPYLIDALAVFAVYVFLLARYGLVSLFVLVALVGLLNSRPVADFQAWYGTGALAYFLVVLGLAIYGYYFSRADRSRSRDVRLATPASAATR
jgi:serine/threonine-protein kinase